MRISDWSSDVCSSDLWTPACPVLAWPRATAAWLLCGNCGRCVTSRDIPPTTSRSRPHRHRPQSAAPRRPACDWYRRIPTRREAGLGATPKDSVQARSCFPMSAAMRSEEHTSELQSLLRLSYAVFCLKKKQTRNELFYE